MAGLSNGALFSPVKMAGYPSRNAMLLAHMLAGAGPRSGLPCTGIKDQNRLSNPEENSTVVSLGAGW